MSQAGSSVAPSSAGERAEILVLSADSHGALVDQARSLAHVLAGRPAVTLADLCYTASRRPTTGRARLALTAASIDELAQQLEAYAAGRPMNGIFHGEPKRPPRIAWIFSGNAAGYVGMGRQLFADEPVFRGALESFAEAARATSDRPLLDNLFADDPAMVNGFYNGGPAIAMVQCAVAALWRSWGLEAEAVVGLSLGELTATHAAGAMRLDQLTGTGLELLEIFRRKIGGGRPAATAVIELPEAQVKQMCAPYGDRVGVIIVNLPSSMVIAGDREAVDGVIATAQREHPNVLARLAHEVDIAVHTTQLDPVREAVESATASFALSPAKLPVYSGFAGGRIEPRDVATELVWRAVRDPVDFYALFGKLIADGYDAFVEISPSPVQLYAIRRAHIHMDVPAIAVSSMQKDSPSERVTMLRALAALHVGGANPRWDAIYPRGHANDASFAVVAPAAASKQDVATERAAPTGSLDEAMTQYLCEQVALVLECAREGVDPLAPFTSLGLDSLRALDVMSRAELDLGVPIEVEMFLQAPDLATLATLLVKQLADKPLPAVLAAAQGEWEQGEL